MTKQDNDRLNSLFQKMELSEPSSAFESKLMKRVQYSVAKRHKKNRIMSFFAAMGLIAGSLAIPVVVFRLMGHSLEFNFSALIPDFKILRLDFNPVVVLIFLSVFLLLVGDIIIREKIREKKEK